MRSALSSCSLREVETLEPVRTVYGTERIMFLATKVSVSACGNI